MDHRSLSPAMATPDQFRNASRAHAVDLSVWQDVQGWNLEVIRHLRRDERERMAANIDVGNGLFDLRHVAGDAIAAGTPTRVVRVRLDGRRVRSIRRGRIVAAEADVASRLINSASFAVP
jgi:hypothetical protein